MEKEFEAFLSAMKFELSSKRITPTDYIICVHTLNSLASTLNVIWKADATPPIPAEEIPSIVQLDSYGPPEEDDDSFGGDSWA